jgi:2-dehydro-3-deoxygluconokinase
MGLYFLSTGAVQRASEVLYDRSGSAFATAPPELVDWDEALAGSTWLHVSGITAAIGPQAAQAAMRAVKAARRARIAVSFDCNYRAKLWEAWGGNPASGLRALAAEADLLFADDRVLALMLAREFEAATAAERFEAASAEAFRSFGDLQRVATTVRVQHSPDHHELFAIMNARGSITTTGRRQLPGIVDRIGAGDAFAAGLLHGLLSALDDESALEFALVAACLKHSLPGDYNLFSVRDVESAMADRSWDVKR